MKQKDIRKTALYAESWNVAWRKGYPGNILSDVETPFNIIQNSYRYWAADPFVYERNGDVFVFAELYDYVLRRGVLGYCKLEDSKHMNWIPIIIEDYHLSYPCIVEQDGKIYLMPESSESKELALYEAVNFPNKWEKKAILRQDVAFADTTPLYRTACRWALTHDINNPYKPELLLIDLKNKFGDIHIKTSNSFQSRPAGHIFQYNGTYIRPAQLSLNCDEGYGKGLLFYSCSIDEEKEYDEQLIKSVMPMDLKYSRKVMLDGMHTYNASENFEVIDIKTRRFNFLNFVFRVFNKFSRHILK